MAISFNSATATAGYVNPATSLSVSVTVNAGSDKFMVAHVAWSNETASVSSVVFNTSENLSLISGTQTTNSGDAEESALYGLKQPSVTTANVVVTISVSSIILCGVGVWNGVDQSTPTENGTVLNASFGASPISLTVTSATGNLVVGGALVYNRDPLAIVSGETQRWERENGGGDTSMHGSEEAGATSVSWQCSFTGADQYRVASGVSLKAAGGGATLMGAIAGLHPLTGLK